MTIMPELTSLDLIHTMEVLEELVRITEKKSMSGNREKTTWNVRRT